YQKLFRKTKLTFGKVAGLKINEKKTNILVKNMRKKEQEDLGRTSGFDIGKKVKYLGVWLTKENLALYQNNYVKLWSQIKQDLERWSKLKLSLLGRISVLKMNVLPRMMFFFQSIPWQKDLTRFIWQGKKPRIRFKLMQDAKERGGLGLPNLKLYFAACCLSWIAKWFWLRDKRLLQLEGFDLRYGLHGYLWYDKVKVNAAFKNHYVRHALWITWSKYRSKLYPRIPMWVSPHEALEAAGQRGGRYTSNIPILFLWPNNKNSPSNPITEWTGHLVSKMDILWTTATPPPLPTGLELCCTE
uniref:Reverse transcriptase n=1 Tax=Salvator merianae TaxID=96440 RepID=A0A8D0KPQ6_SALMN